MKTRIAAMLAGSSLLAIFSPAIAQETQPQNAPRAAADDADSQEDDEIVVTGTFIRGIAPTGNQVLGVTEADIAATGSANGADILASIPQLNYFNQLNEAGQSTTGATASAVSNVRTQIQRPVLRNSGVAFPTGANPTLVLMDGHRLVGAGVDQSSPDVGTIPAGALARTEIITDGGSALYGTDAVGGVINFITRDAYDGVRVDAHYGMGDGFNTYDANITAGIDWGSGSVFGSYTHAESDPVFGQDRDWYKSIEWLSSSLDYGRGVGRNCLLGNVQVGATVYPIDPVTFAPLTPTPTVRPNACDASDLMSINPEETSDSFFFGLSQELTRGIDFNIRGFYSHRETLNTADYLTGSVTIDDETPSPGGTGASPWYTDRPGELANGALQSVLFSYGVPNAQITDVETFNVTPSVKVDLGHEWQLSALVNYGESETFYQNRAVNLARQTAYLTTPIGTALNPYHLSVTNPATIADILNSQNYGFAHQTMTNYRAVFDGPLLTLPGGQVFGAFGGEYVLEEAERRTGATNYGAQSTLPLRGAERDVTAFFGELNIPIVGEGNRLPLLESLVLSLSARHDNYSDFGETTNPAIGLTYEPTDWITFRATWATSFNAPSPVERLGQVYPLAQFTPLPNGVFYEAGDPVSSNQAAILLNGASPNIQPQDAESWSFGFDAQAPFLRNLRLSTTWYKLEFNNTYGSASSVARGLLTATPAALAPYLNFICQPGPGGFIPLGPDADSDVCNDMADFIAQSVNAGDIVGVGPTQLYAMIDARISNFGDLIREGVDVSLRYSHDFDWGTIDTGISGNYQLNAETRTVETVAYTVTDLDVGQSRWSAVANLGVTVGDFYARATLNHTDGFDVTPSAAAGSAYANGQREVDAFDTVDLYFRYDLGSLGFTDQLSVSLNVDNALDQDPSVFMQNATYGATNGLSLGRVFTVGLSAEF